LPDKANRVLWNVLHDNDALEKFEALAPSEEQRLLRWVGRATDDDTRDRRSGALAMSMRMP
jgi:hypothetical protein